MEAHLPPADPASPPGRRVKVRAGGLGPPAPGERPPRGGRSCDRSTGPPRAPGAGAFSVSGGRPSRTTRGGHISAEPRINDRIRVPEVRLVGPNGEQVGIVRIEDALRLAQEADLDLVEVAPMARPPVCKLMDYGKFKYESAMKAREDRKKQVNTVIKEMKLRPKIDPHDYETKKGHVVRFLKAGRQGQDHDHVPRSRAVPARAGLPAAAAARRRTSQELGFVESAPKQDGRNMIMVLGPHEEEGRGHAPSARRSGASRAAGGQDAGRAGRAARRADRASRRPRPTAEAGPTG